MDSLLHVFDENGNPLGRVDRFYVRRATPLLSHHRDLAIRQSRDGKTWDGYTWVKGPPATIPETGYLLPYSDNWQEEVKRPQIARRYLSDESRKDFSRFWDELKFVFSGDDPDSCVGFISGNVYYFWSQPALNEQLKVQRGIYPDKKVDPFWFVTPANVQYGVSNLAAGRPCDFYEAAKNLEENCNATNVRAMFQAYGGGNRVYPTGEKLKFHRFNKSTEHKITKIAYFAEDGWSFHNEGDNELFFLKGVE